MKKRRKVLLIASSGGGGLLQASLAKEQEEKEKNPTSILVKRDMLKDWYGKRVGAFSIAQWNQAQRLGDVKKLKWLYEWQPFADLIFWPRIFYCALATLFKENIDHVIDTQPLGTSAILCALRVFNFWKKKKVFLEKIAVDLPTEKNTHFFRPIKNLSKRNRSLLRLITISPLLRRGQTTEEFWQEHCNLFEDEVVYDFVIRQSFLKLKGVKRSDQPVSLTFYSRSQEEQALIAKVVARGSLQAKAVDKKTQYQISPQNRVVSILLGSQPTSNATEDYVKQFLDWGRKNSEPLNLFVYCAEYLSGENCLFERVSEIVLKEEEYPKNVTVVPFSMQEDPTIAALFHRSDVTCTRSGGQTAMELMCVMSGKIFIHSELKVEPEEKPSLEKLLEGFLGWEGGNAFYMHQKCGAKIVTPELIPDLLVSEKVFD